MRLPWKKPAPEPPSVAQRVGEHRVHLAIAGAITAIGFGGMFFRKRRSTAEVSNAEEPPAASAPPSEPADETPLNTAS